MDGNHSESIRSALPLFCWNWAASCAMLTGPGPAVGLCASLSGISCSENKLSLLALVSRALVTLAALPRAAGCADCGLTGEALSSVSYTHLRAHETPEHLVCRLLLEKKKTHHNTFK
eukprot:TRINITY_DN56781_c0_g1_i2.p1 TRINITY_DN56781_c0_g1~~TRINITY_DN56781_c0_g1_i2.p1  ORF type:complete len:117 (+),score=12.80 TRINITY_DN56781_c0_g1_i2:186-536(+)